MTRRTADDPATAPSHRTTDTGPTATGRSPRPEVARVPGVPETALSEALLATLPVNDAPAPWTVTCSALVWYARGGAAATQALAPALRRGHRGLVVLGGLVRYTDTPVGPYDEVFGLVGSRTGRHGWGSVAFMSVSSEKSLVGGRANWGMPKTLADFTGGPGLRQEWTARSRGDGPAWGVAARVARFAPPALPVRVRSTTRQQLGDGRLADSALDGRGRVRPTLLDVDVTSEATLPTWLRPGRHLGALVESATFTLGAPALD